MGKRKGCSSLKTHKMTYFKNKTTVDCVCSWWPKGSVFGNVRYTHGLMTV